MNIAGIFLMIGIMSVIYACYVVSMHVRTTRPFRARRYVKTTLDSAKSLAKTHFQDANKTVIVPNQLGVFIFVLSRREAFERREMIRNTWGKAHRNFVFVVGDKPCKWPKDLVKPWSCVRNNIPEDPGAVSRYRIDQNNITKKLREEKQVLMVAMEDHYRALPRKLKECYKWGIKHTAAQWFLKTDDDSFVRVDTLGRKLAKLFPYGSAYTVIGDIREGHKVDRFGKWTETTYKSEKYPPFPIGSSGHIVSRDVASYVAENSPTLFEYQGEDVSMGIWLNESPYKKQIKWVNADYMTNNKRCRDKSKIVIGHQLNSEEIKACFDDDNYAKAHGMPGTNMQNEPVSRYTDVISKYGRKVDTIMFTNDIYTVYKKPNDGLRITVKNNRKIMIGIPVHNRMGYVRFSSRVLTQYNHIDPNDIFVFDDASTEFDENKLREWYGKDIKYFRSSKRLKADANTRRLFTYFSKSNYDILLTLDSDLILDEKWKQFVHDHIDKSGVLSLYHSAIGHHKTFNCNGNLCEKKSMGNAGAVMKKGVVQKMLQENKNRVSNFDWGWVDHFKSHGIKMYVPKKSLVFHFGKRGQNNGCDTRELARGFDRSALPSWIKLRLFFYFDKCSNPSTHYIKEFSPSSLMFPKF